MEFGKDILASLHSRLSPAQQAVPSDAVTWPELHARLSAAHAAAKELARGKGTVAQGGFGLWQTVCTPASLSVNPTGLADGKSDQCIEGAFAGKLSTGGRGTR